MNANDPIIILGGGITGLSAAWKLERSGFTNIILIEKSNQAGGKINTLYEYGFVIEQGPDSFIIAKPQALQLIESLGLSSQLIEPLTHKFYVVKNKSLEPAPEGIRMLAPLQLGAFLKDKFFSWPAKHRILLEPRIPVRKDESDESFAHFIERRYGIEMLELYAEPLFAGIYATPSEELSVKAALPTFLDMERQHGSVSRAIMKMSAALNGHTSRSPFLSLRSGIQTLSDSLQKSLKHTKIIVGAEADIIERDLENYRVTTSDGLHYTAQGIICTIPAFAAAKKLRYLAHKASEKLKEFSYASSRILTLAYKKEKIVQPMDATGFIVPRKDQGLISSCTWASSKWAGRAPDGEALIRCFINDEKTSENTLVSLVHNELVSLMGIEGHPECHWLMEAENALPQYKIGHLQKVDAVRKAIAELPRFELAGAYLEGVGLPDCIRQGWEAADRLVNQPVPELKTS